MIDEQLQKSENLHSLMPCFKDLEDTYLNAQPNKRIYDCSNLKTLKKLLDLGMLNVNARYEGENTMLHFAARDANSKAMKMLLENGADANCRNDLDETPMFLNFPSKASNERKRECVEVLMLYGADYDAVNAEGNTVIKVALKNGSFFSLQPIVAHLALLQKRGLPIDNTIFEQIKFVSVLKQYYRKCIGHLEEMKYKRIFEEVTEYEILIQNEETIALSHMGNSILIRKLKEHNFHPDYHYYSSLYKLQISKAMKIKMLRLNADIVFRKSIKLFQYSSHIIVDKIIFHLSNDDLCSLKIIVEEEEKQVEES